MMVSFVKGWWCWVQGEERGKYIYISQHSSVRIKVVSIN